MKLAYIRKFLVAVATALSTSAVVMSDGNITTQDWIVVALSFLGAFGIYAVPNKE